LMLRLRDVMRSPVLTIDADEPVHKAAHVMSVNNIGCLVVTSGGKPVGIVTERDILKKVVAMCRNPEAVKVSEIMSKPLVTGEPDMDIVYAAKLMVGRNVKRLPVVENGKLVGIVTLTDLIRAYPQIVESLEAAVTELPKRFRKWLRK